MTEKDVENSLRLESYVSFCLHCILYVLLKFNMAQAQWHVWLWAQLR